MRRLRGITNRTMNTEPKWRHNRDALTTGYDPRWRRNREDTDQGDQTDTRPGSGR